MAVAARAVIKTYRDLIVWQRSIALVEVAYRVSRSFPAVERFGLTSQLRRAAVSISSNIAEGHGREHLGEYIHHLSIANGSLMELETQFAIAAKLEYTTPEALQAAFDLSGDVGRLLAALIRSLKARIP